MSAFLVMFSSSVAFTVITVAVTRKTSRGLIGVGVPLIIALVATPILGLSISALLTFGPAVIGLRLAGVIPFAPGPVAELGKVGMIAGFFVGALILKIQGAPRS